MNKEFSAADGLARPPFPPHPLGSRAVGIVLAGSAFVAVCAHVALPLWFTPVRFTLQPFAVLLLGLLLAPPLAAATLVAYLVEGAAGLPVFAPGPGFGAGSPICLDQPAATSWPIPLLPASSRSSGAARRAAFPPRPCSAAMGDLSFSPAAPSGSPPDIHTSAGMATNLAVLPVSARRRAESRSRRRHRRRLAALVAIRVVHPTLCANDSYPPYFVERTLPYP